MGPHFHRVVHIVGIGLVAMISLASIGRADGVYIPQRAYPVLPTIPVQRAIIIHRNGVETLIVESAFQTKSPDVAWILPLPAVPSNLQLTEAGAISSTAFSLRPKIVHDLHGIIGESVVICLLILPFCLASIFIRDRARRRARFTEIVLIEILLSCLFSALLPSLNSAGGSGAELAGLSVLSSQRLGDADFTVLNAATPDVLDQWLTEQDLRPLDAAAKPIVADYIARRWCFVVGVLHNSASELSIPRPLMATFPAAVPVFPMKLTALANSTTHVELCVIAADQAVAPGFQCVIADKFLRTAGEPDSDGYNNQAEHYSADKTDTALGHPDIVPLLWDNCTATKLAADLPPAKMDQDITIQFQPLKSQQQTLWTSLSRWQIGWTMLFAGVAIFLILIAVFLCGRRKPTPWQFRILVACFMVVSAAVAATWLFLPTVPVHGSDFRARIEFREMGQVGLVLAKEGLLWPDMTPQQVIAALKSAVEAGDIGGEFLQNPYTGQPIKVECSPGNIALRTVGNKTFFCAYNENGIELRARLTFEATTQATTQPGR
jgi:hypothetical protein